MRKRLVRKTFDMIQEIAEKEDKEVRTRLLFPKMLMFWAFFLCMLLFVLQDYKKFWESFGKFVKLGCIEDTGNHKRLSPLLRFYSSKNETDLISLDQYVENMPENQKAIYYIATDSLQSAKTAPFLEKLVQKDIEVRARFLFTIYQRFVVCLCYSSGSEAHFSFFRFSTLSSRLMRLPFRIYRHTKRKKLLISAKKTWNWVMEF